MSYLRSLCGVAPAIVTGFASALIGVLVAFQAPITDEQSRAIVAAILAAWSLGSALVLHTQTVTNGQADAMVKQVMAAPGDVTPAAIPAADPTMPPDPTAAG